MGNLGVAEWITNLELKRIECGRFKLDSADSGNDSVASLCHENGSELSGCIKGGVFLVQLRAHRVPKKGLELVVPVNCVLYFSLTIISLRKIQLFKSEFGLR